MVRGNKEKGFTIIELVVVIAILGIIAAIALPNFLKYRSRSYDGMARSDAKNAYTAAQAYFSDSPANNNITEADDLTGFGYQQSPDIEITANGGIETLVITVTHTASDTIYTVNSNGSISP